MPYTLKTSQISVKDPETGEYSGVDILAEQTEEGLIAELQAEGTTQVNRINQAAVDVQSAVDKAETDAAKIISDTQTSVNTLEAQKNTIAQTVASMAELGTDTTLSTPGMAADAGAVGELSRQLSDVMENQIPDLKSVEIYSNIGYQTFKGLGNFQHYGLNPDGSFLTSQKYRVSNDDPINIGYPIEIKAADGFRFGYIQIYNTSASAWSGWLTNTEIPQGIGFVLQIARVTENTSEIASVDEFLSAISFTAKDNFLMSEYTKRKDGAIIRDFNSFAHERGQMNSSGGNDDSAYNLNRKIRSVNTVYLNKGDIISVNSPIKAYAIGVALFGFGNTTSSGWITSSYTIPYSGYYRLQIGLINDNEILERDIEKLCSFITIASNTLTADSKIYEFFNSGLTTGRKYNYSGGLLNFNKTTYNIEEKNSLPTLPSGAISSQAVEYFDGIMFVFYDPGIVTLCDYESMDIITTINTGTEHNNCASFSREYYNADDEFPLIYLGSDNSNNDIYVTRITRTEANIIRTLRLPIETAGYHGSECAVDINNNFLWSLGYKINDYQTATNNAMFFCCWNLSNLTDNGNGTFTPQLISKNEIPFINTIQDSKIYDNSFFVVSSNPYVGTHGYTGDKTRIFVISLDGKRITNILSDFNEPIYDHETEGILFVEKDNKTIMNINVLTGRRFDLLF